LNLELEGAFSETASLRSTHYDMSDKPCDNCNMIMVNYTDLCLIHSHITSLLDGVRLKLTELKAHFTLLGGCTSCPLLRSDLEAVAVEIKDLKHKFNHSSCYIILSPRTKHVSLSRVSFSMLPKITPSFNRRSLI
jgi:hypothetical protein